VRGRIPYFITPPERPSDLNEREEKERARASKVKGGEKGEEVRVPGVKQNLGSIMQKNTFVGEDVRPLETIDLEGESEDGEDDGADSADGDDAEAEIETPLAWGDVFAEAGQDVLAETASPGGDEEGEEEEAWSGITLLPEEDEATGERPGDESEEPAKKEKGPRMTTNKKKAENFYTSTNVKNKNRTKAALLKSLQGKNGSRGREKKRKR